MSGQISLRSFEEKYAKRVDTWVEKILCDKPATFIAYILYTRIRVRLLPYYVTIVSFFLRILSALFFLYGIWLQGTLSYFISMIFDSTDGILSRSYFGKDPELRGTLDVMFDQIGLSLVIVALGFRFYNTSCNILLLLLLFYAVLCFLYEFGAATRFRIFSKISLDPNLSILNSTKIRPNAKHSKIAKYWIKLKDIAEKHGIFFHPTIVDSEFLLFVIAPIFKFPPVIVATSLVFVAIGVILGLSAAIWSIRNLKDS
ncbi:MAG: CDP-alcohol phosphatidyltransferase family protein [Candidatus Marinimicrobia bacterium]|nr:CDP-alcohol phosphatidyltransferase family protein [Candidatus Neomarinimicrobiota bacterium]